MSKARREPKVMGEFEHYVRPDNNLKEYYDEFEGAGPAERTELIRCRDIDRRVESMGGGYNQDIDIDDWEN